MTTMTSVALERDALAERLVAATVSALELYGVHLGLRLGLYRALADRGPLTAAGLAEAAGVHPRYAREWLEQQAVAGLVRVDGGDADARRFTLPAPHRAVLVDPEDPAHVAPLALLVAGIGQTLPDLVDAYRSGGGVSWARYGADARDGQAAANRPVYRHDLPSWLAAMPDVEARLDGGSGRIADLGCGAGWSTIALARRFPTARVVGLDADPSSVADAVRNVRDAGLADRVGVELVDAAEGLSEGGFDLVCLFEALHDLARPVEALASARSMLAPGGSVLVVDERVAESFTAPGDELERLMYGWSITLCLPTALAEQPSAGTGTVLRPAALRRLAAEAGFASTDVLPVEHDVFRLYRLRP